MRPIVLIILSIAMVACTHKPFVPHPTVLTVTCDTVNVSYSTNIQPIINNNCYSCHSTAATSSGGLNLQDFQSLKAYLAYGFRGDGVYGSKLYHCITHARDALPMPPVYTLDSCSLSLIKAWIDIGAPDN